MGMRIDAHQHYWSIARGDYGWITPELPLMNRDYLPEMLEAHLKRHGIDRTIVVQAAQTAAETEYLLELSERTESIAGVVGLLDLFDPGHRELYEKFRGHPKFVGFRVMIQEMEDASAVLEDGFVEGLTYYAQLGVPVDLLVLPHQLDVLMELADRVPGLRGVIDHLGKPPIASGRLDPWREQLTRLAAHPNLYCKLSGMVTEADHKQWRTGDFLPYVRHIVEAFGTKRILFGSDWPVCLLAADYDQVVEVLERSLPQGLTEEERADLYGNNAAGFYKLGAK
ncbi:amidohydrolase 2 [Paenibacillus mucilaginosus 3016]|uniref:Amidohydrolase 2 n=1 Tax=Paenibacillus mucilaginosus 3016 TaxID=1116391 RepID=H6NDH9_9BACL|nr:amidohydrolase family protein [Paenibacillus mucilaginosus]AFC31319.1 amidohydrolase 2 [Paenibacillus mucilaginosus 3016]WFA19883.1 amidohydrolase [Paenibacillus mucilaginosus]